MSTDPLVSIGKQDLQTVCRLYGSRRGLFLGRRLSIYVVREDRLYCAAYQPGSYRVDLIYGNGHTEISDIFRYEVQWLKCTCLAVNCRCATGNSLKSPCSLVFSHRRGHWFESSVAHSPHAGHFSLPIPR